MRPPSQTATPRAPTAPRSTVRRAWRRRGLALAGVVAAAVVVAVAIGVVRQPPADPEGRVVLYGDSLSFEAHGAFAAELAATTRSDLVTRVVPGTSPCDHLAAMEADRALRPDVVVIQFVGNNASPCALGPDGQRLVGQALADRTEADVRSAVELWAAAGHASCSSAGPTRPAFPARPACRSPTPTTAS